MIYIWST